ncbi:adenine deaminase [soil metagenome]
MNDPIGQTATFDTGAWRQRIVAARGTAQADLLLAGGHVANVFTGELEEANVAVVGGRIAGVGNYSRAAAYVDCRGKVISPSFVDPHIHLESSLVWVSEFARAVIPRGTGLVITDPHEMANVLGLPGLDAMRWAARRLPMHIRFTAPSCVPASPWESPGAQFGADEIAQMLAWPETVGLGELMNVAAATSGDALIGRMLAIAAGRRHDGHAPGVTGARLQTYLAAGIHSDHESTELAEAYTKLQSGLMIMIREGTSERNLKELLPLASGSTFARCTFCSDDRDCKTLQQDGHVDAIVRLAIAGGLDPVRAIRLATWNAADYWRIDGVGSVAAGYEANLIVLDDLEQVQVGMTMFQGQVVARDGAMVTGMHAEPAPDWLKTSVNTGPLTIEALALTAERGKQAVRVVPGQIVTKHERIESAAEQGYAISDPGQDLLKLVCVERHRATGRVGVGYVRGFGLKSGALASSIAHDAHNIVAVGVADQDILTAVQRVAAMQGGLVAVSDGQVTAELPLPIAGIMSDQPLASVVEAIERLDRAAQELGSELEAPFGTLAFMALSVIPEARVTDMGYVRVS